MILVEKIKHVFNIEFSIKNIFEFENILEMIHSFNNKKNHVNIQEKRNQIII